jgi:thiamine-monophosphate kinase
VFLAISASPDFDADFIERVINGLQAYGLRFGVQLAGGDTTSTSGPLVLTLTLIGTCPRDEVVYRSGAKPGDSVFVTGTPGDSGAGFLISQGSSPGLSGKDRKYLIRRHHRPEPRIGVGRKLASDRVATAMIDVSDGLGADLRHICQQSQVDVVIDPALLPVSDALAAFCEASNSDPVDMVLSSGEDYELAFTTRSGDFCTDWDAECRLTHIGRVVPGSGLTRIGSDEENQVYDKKGFDHFSGSREAQ